MRRILAYFWGKRLEILLAIVIATILLVWHAPMGVFFYTLAITISTLAIYDHELVSRGAQYSRVLIKTLELEIFLLTVLVSVLALWGFPLVYSYASIALYFFIVLAVNETVLFRFVLKSLKEMYQQPLALGVLLITILLLAIWRTSFELIGWVSVFIAFLLYDWDNRILAGAAFLSLTACPILLAINTDASNVWAEQMATYAYFFLVMTVALQMIDLKRHPE